MSLFCLLWVPFFYILRRSFAQGGGSSGGVWALLLGSIAAILQFFLGYMVSPGGFGLSRALFGFIDIVSLPVIIPILIYVFMNIFRGFSGEADFANFTLLWLIPVGGFRALSWSSLSDPILLVMTPLLWTALAVGISFLINWLKNCGNVFLGILSILCMIILPVTAAGAYWAFFSQYTLIGFGLLLFTNIPLGLSLYFDIKNS
ncbi:MAG: hypothetical protein FWB95_00450 [Treponema sp.]|nr:hypothetical protein [Treponema sp.]